MEPVISNFGFIQLLQLVRSEDDIYSLSSNFGSGSTNQVRDEYFVLSICCFETVIRICFFSLLIEVEKDYLQP